MAEPVSPIPRLQLGTSPSQAIATDVVQRFVDGYALSDIANHHALTRLTVERVIRESLRGALTMSSVRPPPVNVTADAAHL